MCRCRYSQCVYRGRYVCNSSPSENCYWEGLLGGSQQGDQRLSKVQCYSKVHGIQLGCNSCGAEPLAFPASHNVGKGSPSTSLEKNLLSMDARRNHFLCVGFRQFTGTWNYSAVKGLMLALDFWSTLIFVITWIWYWLSWFYIFHAISFGNGVNCQFGAWGDWTLDPKATTVLSIEEQLTIPKGQLVVLYKRAWNFHMSEPVVSKYTSCGGCWFGWFGMNPNPLT